MFAGVAFKKTFSYAGFEMQRKSYESPKLALLNVELELKAEKENAEIRVDNVEVITIFIVNLLHSSTCGFVLFFFCGGEDERIFVLYSMKFTFNQWSGSVINSITVQVTSPVFSSHDFLRCFIYVNRCPVRSKRFKRDTDSPVSK